MYLRVKKLNQFIFTHAPKQNYYPGFHRYPPGRRELPISPEQRFLKIFFPEEKETFQNVAPILHSGICSR